MSVPSGDAEPCSSSNKGTYLGSYRDAFPDFFHLKNAYIKRTTGNTESIRNDILIAGTMIIAASHQRPVADVVEIERHLQSVVE